MSLEIGVGTTGNTSSRQAWADWAGMAASIGCAIHCAAMPLVFAYLPALGLSWLADEGFHRVMAIICFGLALAAFVPGWRKHRSLFPIAWGVAGLILLNTAAFALEGGCCSSCSAGACNAEASCLQDCTTSGRVDGEVALKPTDQSQAMLGFPVALLTPLGGLLLVVGHVANHQKNCRCGSCNQQMSVALADSK